MSVCECVSVRERKRERERLCACSVCSPALAVAPYLYTSNNSSDVSASKSEFSAEFSAEFSSVKMSLASVEVKEVKVMSMLRGEPREVGRVLEPVMERVSTVCACECV